MDEKDCILIVEDDESFCNALRLILGNKGYRVVTAENAEVALRQIENQQPDLVILDIMLPDVSGIEVCQRVRSKSETSNLPIIMLSARVQVPDKVKGLEAGADEYVTKPVDSDELVARVAALLERTRRLRQAQPVKTGKALGFVGAKGGVGTTTVALNVASALARQGKAAIAVELRAYYGTFAPQMNLAPAENLTNLLELDPERISERELSRRLVSSPFGFKVLVGPQKVEEFKDIEPDEAEAVIKGLARMADYTIIDLPCQPSSASQAAIRHCDYVTLVVEPEPTCLMSGRLAVQLLRAWGMAGPLVGAVVVTRAMVPLPMSLPEISSQLGCQIIGVVPPAAEACRRAQKFGVPLVSYEPDSTAARALTEIANRLIGDSVIPIKLL